MNFFANNKKRKIIVAGITFLAVVILGSYFFFLHISAPAYQTPQEADIYVRFMMEAYDAIGQNYWIKEGNFKQFNTPELPQLFQLAVKKEGSSATLATSTRSATADLLENSLRDITSTDAKRQFALQTLSLVLYNLLPVGRNSVLSQQQEIALRQDVANVNPKTGQIEPSVFPRILGRTLYLNFNKISPTTLREFTRVVDDASTTPNLDSMILDMRGNVGGALDFAQAFLGLFIGTNQYAFDLYHQGDNQVQRTTTPQFPKLPCYGEVAVLTDGMTQSTAELTAAVLKRFHLARIVGTMTRGWGSVENTYPLKTSIDSSTSYALLLVNSLTLRDDQQPIEQNGVIPDIDTSKTGWQKKLQNYFTSPSLIKALLDEANNKRS